MDKKVKKLQGWATLFVARMAEVKVTINNRYGLRCMAEELLRGSIRLLNRMGWVVRVVGPSAIVEDKGGLGPSTSIHIPANQAIRAGRATMDARVHPMCRCAPIGTPHPSPTAAAAVAEVVKDAKQNAFDSTIGRLDRVLSEVMALSKMGGGGGGLDGCNIQTLKHHIEDMELCAASIRKRLALPRKGIGPDAWSKAGGDAAIANATTLPWSEWRTLPDSEEVADGPRPLPPPSLEAYAAMWGALCTLRLPGNALGAMRNSVSMSDFPLALADYVNDLLAGVHLANERVRGLAALAAQRKPAPYNRLQYGVASQVAECCGALLLVADRDVHEFEDKLGRDMRGIANRILTLVGWREVRGPGGDRLEPVDENNETDETQYEAGRCKACDPTRCEGPRPENGYSGPGAGDGPWAEGWDRRCGMERPVYAQPIYASAAFPVPSVNWLGFTDHRR